MQRLLPPVYALILLAEIAVLSWIYATDPPAPSEPLSVWLGSLGLGSMVVLLAYSLARRSAAIRRIAQLKVWLHLHIFLALQGFVFVVFHSLPMFWNATFHWLNPAVLNFIGVCIVIASGVFGRWLFAQVPKTLGGRHMAAKEVEAELAGMQADLPSSITRLWGDLPQTRSFLGILAADRYRRGALRELRALDLPDHVRALAERRLRLEGHKAALSVTQRVFRWWILLHRPLAAILYILSVVHVLLSLMFTPSLRFF